MIGENFKMPAVAAAASVSADVLKTASAGKSSKK
jgi:hypothetical protein